MGGFAAWPVSCACRPRYASTCGSLAASLNFPLGLLPSPVPASCSWSHRRSCRDQPDPLLHVLVPFGLLRPCSPALACSPRPDPDHSSTRRRPLCSKHSVDPLLPSFAPTPTIPPCVSKPRPTAAAEHCFQSLTSQQFPLHSNPSTRSRRLPFYTHAAVSCRAVPLLWLPQQQPPPVFASSTEFATYILITLLSWSIASLSPALSCIRVCCLRSYMS
jgi:hypothetical protein